jgi:hypothetical protein
MEKWKRGVNVLKKIDIAMQTYLDLIYLILALAVLELVIGVIR